MSLRVLQRVHVFVSANPLTWFAVPQPLVDALRLLRKALPRPQAFTDDERPDLATWLRPNGRALIVLDDAVTTDATLSLASIVELDLWHSQQVAHNRRHTAIHASDHPDGPLAVAVMHGLMQDRTARTGS